MKKTLATLIKLQKTYVDEQRILLARLQIHLEEVETEIMELEVRKVREQIVVKENPASAMTYGNFVRWAIDHGQELEEKRIIAETAVNLARERLAELFEEQKRNAIAETMRLEGERKGALRIERIDRDEVGSVSFERRMREI